MSTDNPCRKARYAGSWYAGDAESLRREIDGYLAASASDIDSYRVRMGVLPHAGLYYSGKGIARFFNNLPEETERICIIAPSHYAYLESDTITSADYTALETPLAELPCVPMCDAFPDSMKSCSPRAVGEEHAVEMALPFIARIAELRGKSISVSLMLVSSFSSGDVVREIASHLIEGVGKESILSGKTVLIASSDFTHYGARFGHTPYGSDDIGSILSSVEEHDRSFADGFAAGKIDELLQRYYDEHPTICGFAPALLLSEIARVLGLTGVVVDYYSSNDLAKVPLPDFVSYCTVFWE